MSGQFKSIVQDYKIYVVSAYDSWLYRTDLHKGRHLFMAHISSILSPVHLFYKLYWCVCTGWKSMFKKLV